MPTPVPKSAPPLLPETLPALKLPFLYGAPPKGNIYTQVRLYMGQHGLSLNLCAFERTPPDESRLSFSVFCAGEAALLLSFGPEEQGASLWQLPAIGFDGPELQKGTALFLPFPPAYIAGADEQGWYWGATVIIPSTHLQAIGCSLSNGALFHAGAFKHQAGYTGFSSSVAPRNGRLPPMEDFPSFQIVSY